MPSSSDFHIPNDERNRQAMLLEMLNRINANRLHNNDIDFADRHRSLRIRQTSQSAQPNLNGLSELSD